MNSPEIVEAMLEAQYMRVVARCLADIYGNYTFQFYKPSAQEEAFVGFDQGWVRTASVPARAMFDEIRSALANPTRTPSWLWAFFLQFKRVEVVRRSSPRMPGGFSPPYLRVEVSLRPNRTTLKSQHQTLLELAAIARSEVYYACPMMFSRDDVYRDVDPDTLRLIDVATAPAGYLANERHYIAFRVPLDATPAWCSEPVSASALSPMSWLELRRFEDRFGEASASVLNTLITLRKEYQQQAQGVFHQVVVLPERVTVGYEPVEPDDDWSPAGVPLSLVLVRAVPL